MEDELINRKNWWQRNWKWLGGLALIAILATGLFSITTGLRQKKAEREQGMPLDRAKWNAKDENGYMYRNKMLKDLTTDKLQHIKSLSKDGIFSMLGQPDRIDNNYFFYRITEERIGLVTLHATTLVIKTDPAGNTVLIHE